MSRLLVLMIQHSSQNSANYGKDCCDHQTHFLRRLLTKSTASSEMPPQNLRVKLGSSVSIAFLEGNKRIAVRGV